MSARDISEYTTFLDRVISHAAKHIELAKAALEQREWETLDFVLSIVAQDVLNARRYLTTLKEAGLIKMMGGLKKNE